MVVEALSYSRISGATSCEVVTAIFGYRLVTSFAASASWRGLA
jgi:hypothetical protein